MATRHDPRAVPLRPAVFHILLALSGEDRHGLGIADEIERTSGGSMVLGPGTLYRSLAEMADAGLIRSVRAPGRADPRRKVLPDHSGRLGGADGRSKTPAIDGRRRPGPQHPVGFRMSVRCARLHAALFRALLRVYPGWFRRAHGEEMEQLFLARLGRGRGPRAALALWTRVAGDTASTTAALRRRHTVQRPPNRGGGGFDMLWQDIRFGLRRLLRTPAFTLGALALLAVGLGANIAVFSIVDRLLLRPPPYTRPAEVVYIHQDSDDGEPGSNSFPAYRDMAAMDVFRAVAATSPDDLTWQRPDGDTDVIVEFTTASYLDVVGLKMLRGRWFSSDHDRVGAEPVAVVSAPAWRSRFGGDPNIVGRVIRLNGQPVTIVGVGPDGLSGSQAPVVTDFWVSISATVLEGQYRVANLERREDHWYDVMARLAPGVSVEQGRSAMTVLAGRLADSYPDLNRGRRITVQRALDVHPFPESSPALVLASAMVVVLLLLACANLANLLLVRGMARTSEMAIRRALGAGSVRIGRLHLVESLVLSLGGGVAGVFLADVVLSALPRAPLPPPFGHAMDLTVDTRVGVFAIVLMVATGLLFGLAPVLRGTRERGAGALSDDRRTASSGRATVRVRNALVVVQVAGSFVFVMAAGLFGRSLLAMQHADTGVDAEHVAFVRTSVASAGVTGVAAGELLDQIRQRIDALPGVVRAAAASKLPAQFAGTTTTIVEGYTPPAGTDAVELNYTIVTPEYFDTVGLGIVQGRAFASTDVAGANRVAIVNEAAARRFWGGDAVGRRLESQGSRGTFRTVVGVAEDAPVSTFPEQPIRPMFYAPSGQASLGSAYLLAKTAGDAGALPDAMRSAVTAVRPGLTVGAQGTLASHFNDALAGQRFLVRVLESVSILAMLLAALGIYAVVAFNVAGRTGELGLRIALGARPGRVVRMVVQGTLVAVSIGLVSGLVIVAVAIRQVQSALFGVEPLDPVTIVGAVALLALVGGLAAYAPARRAASTDPAKALRAT